MYSQVTKNGVIWKWNLFFVPKM